MLYVIAEYCFTYWALGMTPVLSKRLLVLDVICFQLVWFSCVFSGVFGTPFLALAAVISYVIVHNKIITKIMPSLVGIVLLVIAGFIVDVTLTQSGLLRYENHGSFLPPLWILSLWVALGFSMGGSLNWLNDRPLVAFCLFGLSGSLSYRAGSALGAAEIIGDPFVSFASIFFSFAAIGVMLSSGLISLRPKEKAQNTL